MPATGSLSIIAQPDHGSVVITDPSSTPTNPNDDVVTYTPDADYNGTDTFEYEICDSAVPANCSSAEATITVNAVADAIADEETTDEDESVVVTVLDNDLEVPATGSLTIIAQPNHGSVVITDPSSTPTNPNDDVVTYTPNANYNGTDTFEYEICDSAVPANCSSAEATITVNAVADAIADAETTDEDESVVVAVLDNDLEVPATGTLSIITAPVNGSVVITDPSSTPANPNDDVVTYTPDANYNGTDTFEYEICDSAIPANCSSEVATITVNPIADPLPDQETTDEDESVEVAVLDNDVDVPVTGSLSIITAPVNGSVVITDPNSTPTNPNDDVVTYTPDANYNGTDTFEYQICDSAVPANCASEVATITVNAVADAIADEESTYEDEAVVVAILDNDLEVPATGTLTIISVPDHGSVLITDPNNTPTNPNDDVVTYTPESGYIGTATFEYQICDSAVPANCSSAEATITVNPIPVAVEDEERTDEDESVVVAILNNDTGLPSTGELIITNNPTNGSVLITDPNNTPTNPNDDVVTYTPDANYNGTDTFEYQICDSAVPASCSSAEATITINAVADAITDEEITDEDEAVVVAILSNDLEVPATGTLTISTAPDHGSVLITDPNNTPTNPNDDVVTYTPNANYNGTDTFEYQICDSAVPANCSSAEATITVNAVADAIDDEEITDEDEAVEVAVLGNDLEVPATGTLTIITAPDHGSILITDPNNTPANPNDDVVTYTPDANYNGTDTFEYQICDDAVPANCSSAVAAITINSTADAIDDNENTDEDQAVVVHVLDNDVEVPATGVLTIVTEPANGSVFITDPNNTPTDPNDDVVTYTPASGYIGTDTFEYQICDSAIPANCSSAVATITVNAIPVAVVDSENTTENEAVIVDVLDNDTAIPTTGILTITSDPTNGSVAITDPENTPTDPSDDVVTYTPDVGYIGTDTFEYQICNGSVPTNCAIAEVSVTVVTCLSILTADCDNDGLTNAEETEAGTNPSDIDSDGDGVSDGQEVIDGTSPNSSCDLVVDNQDLTADAAWQSGDCDNDGNTNSSDPEVFSPSANDEFTNADVGVPHTINIIANDDFVIGSTIHILTTGTATGTIQINSETGELTYTPVATDILVTIDYEVCNGNVCGRATVTIATPGCTDSDGDNICDENDSAPNNACAPNDHPNWIPSAFSDCDTDELTFAEETTGVNDPNTTANPDGNLTDPTDIDSDGDGVTDGQEAIDGTNPNSSCDYEIDSITETVDSGADCDGDLLLDIEEIDGVDDPSTSANPNGNSTDPADIDSDGDGVTDGQEAFDGTNPNDSCDYKVSSITEAIDSRVDCDADGLLDVEEITGIDYLITIANPDGNITDPTDIDSDGDGVSDGQEALDGTDPNDSCSYEIESIAFAIDSDVDCDRESTDPIDPCTDSGGTLNTACNIDIESDLMNMTSTNGVFLIKNIEFFPENTVRIYNRWGILVYQTIGYNNTDNVFVGESKARVTINEELKLPVGVYYYFIDYKRNGEAANKKGYMYINY